MKKEISKHPPYTRRSALLPRSGLRRRAALLSVRASYLGPVP
eukprot:SAG31_NODE_42417_length_271_cov_1.755814_1_plen_41_part_10